jgi:amidase
MRRTILFRIALIAAAAAAPLAAETRRIIPDRYYDTFAAHPPIAHLKAGDTVFTKLLDSRGRDETGKLVLDAGNVLNGPFYIEGAEPGDMLVVSLDRVRLNRNWGWNGVRVSLDSLAPGAIEGIFPADCCEEWLQPGRRNALKWDIDLEKGILTPSRPLGQRARMAFPTHPAVGCIGVAPAGKQAISSGPSGPHGGNVDYNGMDEGAIVYLPVFERGAYLMIGDGHAGHGDGELLGQGTETSMDVEFTLQRIVKKHPLRAPRLEHPDSLVTFGLTTSQERGFRDAITDMIAWLQSDYGLAPQEAHVLVAMSGSLRVASWFGTYICQVPKRYLPEKK